MDFSYHLNITRIRAIANALKGLDQKFVFVGGATVALYADPDTASEIRPTNDVDVVVEMASYGGYAQLEERLRTIGFKNDLESKVVCRYSIEGVIVDIMPTDPSIIGFSNRWYKEGYQYAEQISIAENEYVFVFPLQYLIASKFEAFFSRGNADFIFSHDFEDLVYLFENATHFSTSLISSEGELRDYLKSTFSSLIKRSDWEEGLYAHLSPYHASYHYERIQRIIKSFLML
jgi:hypothetical protein